MALRSLSEKSASLAVSAFLALGPTACSDTTAEGPNSLTISAIAGDINGRLGDGSYGDSPDSGIESFDSGSEDSVPDAVDQSDVPTNTEDVVAEDVAPDAVEQSDSPTATEDAAPDAVDQSDVPTNTEDAAEDIIPADVESQPDLTASTDISVVKGGMCTEAVLDECLKQFQEAMCIDPCTESDKQVEAEMQSKANELIEGFDKLVSGLNQPPKSSIFVGKLYEITDGNVDWTVSIKNALMDSYHIEYILEKYENGNSEKLTWLVTESTLVPQKLQFRTDTTNPCVTTQYKTVDASPSNLPSVKIDNNTTIDDTAEMSIECKNLNDTIPTSEDTCSPSQLGISVTDQCGTGEKPSNKQKLDFFETQWGKDSYPSKADYEAFIAKTFSQVQAMLQKHGLDVTN